LSFSYAQAQTDCAVPSAGEDLWPIASPEIVGLSGGML
jgi:hypothetical protein